MEQNLAAAANMASRNPAAFLGLGDTIGSIAPGKRADLVLMTDDLHVARSWIAGREG
jgi:N-acetylglucosamine-6-phosphate deacetylase